MVRPLWHCPMVGDVPMGGVQDPLNSTSCRIHCAMGGGRLLMDCLPSGVVFRREWATAVLLLRHNGVLYPPDGLFAHFYGPGSVSGLWCSGLYLVCSDLIFVHSVRAFSIPCHLVLTFEVLGAFRPLGDVHGVRVLVRASPRGFP